MKCVAEKQIDINKYCMKQIQVSFYMKTDTRKIYHKLLKNPNFLSVIHFAINKLST